MFYSYISIFIDGFSDATSLDGESNVLSTENDDVGKTLFCPATGNTEVSKMFWKEFSLFDFSIQQEIKYWVAMLLVKQPQLHMACLFWNVYKTRRVSPVTNRPSSDPLHHFLQKNVTCDMWHVICDGWHVTCDKLHVTGGGRQTFSQNVSSIAFLVSKLGFVAHICTKDNSLG